MMAHPKDVQDLSVISTFSSKQAGEIWVETVTKDTSGAMSTLMSVDGSENKMDTTLLNILDEAQSDSPKNASEINEYKEMILRRSMESATLVPNEGIIKKMGGFFDLSNQ